MKRLLLPSLFVIATTTACKGEAPVGGVTGNANAGNGTASGAGNGSAAGASSTGGTTGAPAGGSGGEGTVAPVGGSSGTTGNAGSTAAGPREPAPITRIEELDGGLDDADLYATYVDTFNYGFVVDCACDGTPVDLCASAIVQLSPLELECETETTFADANGRSYVECHQLAEERFVDCMIPTEGEVCSSTCYGTYDAALSECPSLADDTWIAVGERCYGAEPFECDDGDTRIPRFRLCDLTSDCADQTDEVLSNCPN